MAPHTNLKSLQDELTNFLEKNVDVVPVRQQVLKIVSRMLNAQKNLLTKNK